MDKIQSIKLLLIIEGEFATTQLIELVVGACDRHGISYEKRFLKDLQLSDFRVGAIPLFIRCGDPLARAWTRTLVRANRTYAYYLDDNFWRIEGGTLLAAYYRHPAVRRALEFSVSNARVVITNSEELARFLSRFNKQTVVLPAFFDFSLLKDHKEPNIQDEIRIGFAGSVPRVRDLDLIAPVLPRILAQFPRAVFEFIGACPSEVKPSDRVRFFSEHWAHLFRQLAREHGQSAQSLDGRYLRGLKLKRERLGLRIHVMYQAGGMLLVGKHALGKLLHTALRVRKLLLNRLRGIS